MAVAVVALFGASAFADSRPSRETSTRVEDRNVIRRESANVSSESRRGNDSYRERANVSSESRRGNDSYRERSSSNGRYRSNDHRQPYYVKGRISKVSKYRGGYRVWVGGARYPFYVPMSYWHRDRFRVGVAINIGGYYNPAGYYDYYNGAYSNGALRGVVESVDYRRDSFVIRNDATGSFVTVLSRDRRSVRPGDYVEVEGTWARSGLFTAYDVDMLDYGRRY